MVWRNKLFINFQLPMVKGFYNVYLVGDMSTSYIIVKDDDGKYHIWYFKGTLDVWYEGINYLSIFNFQWLKVFIMSI